MRSTILGKTICLNPSKTSGVTDVAKYSAPSDMPLRLSQFDAPLLIYRRMLDDWAKIHACLVFLMVESYVSNAQHQSAQSGTIQKHTITDMCLYGNGRNLLWSADQIADFVFHDFLQSWILQPVQCTLINILDSPNIFSEAAIWATTKIPHPGECFWHSSVISVTFFLFWTYCANLLFSVALSVMRYKSLLQCNAGSRPQLQPVARGGHCLKYSQGRTIQYSSPGAPHCPTPTYIYLGNQN